MKVGKESWVAHLVVPTACLVDGHFCEIDSRIAADVCFVPLHKISALPTPHIENTNALRSSIRSKLSYYGRLDPIVEIAKVHNWRLVSLLPSLIGPSIVVRAYDFTATVILISKVSSLPSLPITLLLSSYCLETLFLSLGWVASRSWPFLSFERRLFPGACSRWRSRART